MSDLVSGRRAMWSERHALRDQVIVLSVGFVFVLVMAVALIVVSHTS